MQEQGSKGHFDGSVPVNHHSYILNGLENISYVIIPLEIIYCVIRQDFRYTLFDGSMRVVPQYFLNRHQERTWCKRYLKQPTLGSIDMQ